MKNLSGLLLALFIIFSSCKPTPPKPTDKEAVKEFLISHTFYASGMDRDVMKFYADGTCGFNNVDKDHHWHLGNCEESACGIVIDDEDGNNSRNDWQLGADGVITHNNSGGQIGEGYYSYQR